MPQSIITLLKSKKDKKFWRATSFLVVFLLLVNVFYFSGVFNFNVAESNLGIIKNVIAESVWPDCGWVCTANDVNLNKLWLGDAEGNPLSQSSCQAGQNLTAYVWGEFNNGAGKERYKVMLLADSYINGVFSNKIDQCTLDEIVPGISNASLFQLEWECGSEIKLENITVAWDTNSGSGTCSTVDRTCNKFSKSQCSGYKTLIISAPLIASFTTNAPQCQGGLVTFDGKATGGEGNYAYSWDFGDGSSTSTDEDPSHSYSAPGTYNVVLTVVSEGSVDTETQTITIDASGSSSCPTYSWSVGEWGACSATCGSGTKTRTVSCSRNDSLTVDDSFCDSSTRPSSEESCNLGACATCGDGIMNQESEQCDAGENNGVACTPGYNSTCSYCSATCQTQPVAGSFCGDGELNAGEEVCEIGDQQACNVDGYSGSQSCLSTCSGWSACVVSESCGDGIKNGTEECDGQDGVGDHYQCTSSCTLDYVPYCGDGIKNQPNEQCDGALSEDYPTGYTCNSDCLLNKSFSCGQAPTSTVWNFLSPYEGTYSQTCSSFIEGSCSLWDPADGQPYYSAEPTAVGCSFACATGYSWNGEECLADEVLTYIWDTSNWGTCSASCNGGTQAREVKCVTNNQEKTVVEDSNCTETKPVSSQACNTQSCGGSGGGGGGGYISQPAVVVLGEEGKPVLEIKNKFLLPFANPGSKGVSYEMIVTNTGNLTSFETILNNILPLELAYSDDGTQERNWSLGDIASGESKVITVNVDVAESAIAKNYTSIASASSTNHEKVSSSTDLEVRVIEVLAETGFSLAEFSLLLATLFVSLVSVQALKRKLAKI